MLALSPMNSRSRPAPLVLACHPQTPSRAVRGIDAVVDMAPGHSLILAFALEGDLAGLRIPESRAPRRTDGLWRHTCFEAFVMARDGVAYREFNLSPSGEWAVHAFSNYREGGEPESGSPPVIGVHRTLNRLELDAKIPLEYLPPGRLLRMGLSAVVEEVGGELTYWALRHPPGRPDFHHVDGFAFQLVQP